MGESMSHDNKPKIGRPSRKTPEMTATICRRLIEGESLRRICRDAEMPAFSRVAEWLAKDPVFRDQYMQARQIQAELEAERMVDIADDVAEDNAAVQKARLQIDVRKWNAVKLLPKKYGDWRQVEVKGHLSHEQALALLEESDTDGNR